MPAPQGSKRHIGKGILVESSKRVKPWRSDVCQTSADAFQGDALVGPVAAELEFVFPRPAGHYRTGKNAHLLKEGAPEHPTARTVGDIEKLARSTIDALSVSSGGCVLLDDSLVVELFLRKRYAKRHERIGAWVRIRSITAVY